MLGTIADLTWSRPRLVLGLVFALALGAAAFARDVEDHLEAAGFTDSASESERAGVLLRDALGYDPNPGLVVVLRARDGGRLDLADAAIRAEIGRLAGELERARHVGRVVDPLRGERPELVARDGRSVVLTGHLSARDVESDGGEAAEDVARNVRSDMLRVAVGGFAPSFNEVNDQTRDDLTRAELIAFPILAVLLVLVFRSVIAALIPLLIGGLSIVGTLLVLRLMSEVTDTSLFALNIATGLSLGLAVDYALLLVSRYREEVAAGRTALEAHRRTVLSAGRAALFSGLTIAAAMISLVLLPQRFLYSLGAAGAAVGILSALIAILVVPSLLRLLGPRLDSLSVRRGPAVSDTSDRWYRLARGVMRRPVAVAVATAGVLLATASPLLSTHLTGPSAEAVPDTQPSFHANAYVNGHYGRALTEAATVTVRGAASTGELAALGRRIARIDGVRRPGEFTAASRTVAYANAELQSLALSGRSQDAVRAIRRLEPPAGATILVSGNTARFIDQKQSLIDHAPLVVGAVSLTTLLLLFALTGSVLLPLKTLLMNALTLAATLGFLVLAFEDGWLEAPLSYAGPEAIEVTSLVFLFAVTFGLATDYAVLVMARIKEHHDAGMENTEAVATGIGRTGRVISAAAVMIAVVFLAFAVSPVFFMKQIAIGMAVGVLIDATIVRALLVPALMRLFGELNWWAPRPLRALHTRFAARGH